MALSCFVAMAFDGEDTDEWFSKSLKPTLKQFGITVRRVDQINHNDDIDDRIIAEIERADLVVADLTYARPSVYFEAGYATAFALRKIPVIYTVRADHFERDPSREADYRRVHFDLTMKNIIAWKTARDPIFEKRLSKRVALVTAPILRERQREVASAESRAAFQSLSVSSQLDEMASAFRDVVAATTWIKLRPPLEPALGYVVRDVVGQVFDESRVVGLQAQLFESCTKSALTAIYSVPLLSPRFSIQPPTSRSVIESIHDIFFVLSLKSVPVDQVTASMPLFGIADRPSKHFRLRTEQPVPASRIPGYSRVAMSSELPGHFVGYRSDEFYTTYFVPELSDGRDTRRSIGGYRERVPAKIVERTIDVAVIDAIRDAGDLESRVRVALERWLATVDR